MDNNISIVWDFDGTLTPDDSTSKTIDVLTGEGGVSKFWKNIKELRGDSEQLSWEHVLASDAPIWMYSLSRLASSRNIPLNKEFFKKFVLKDIQLYPRVIEFLKEIKQFENLKKYKEVGLKINHFVVSAGLKDLIEECFPANLIEWTFGCRYTVTYEESKKTPQSIPVFCMDETMKTRALFEISKGTFNDPERPLNSRVSNEKLWCPFQNIIYIGDGPTDIPALSLVRDRGGLGVVVFDGKKDELEIKERLREMSLDRRADLITKADFSFNKELFNYIKVRCDQLVQQYEAANIDLLRI